jgi:PAS domain S-box-containing protein
MIDDFGLVYRVEPDNSFFREWVSPSFVRITGYSHDDLDKHNGWHQLFHPDDAPRIDTMLNAVLLGNEMVDDCRIITQQNQTRWIRFALRPVWNTSRQRIVRVFGVGHDLTEERAIQSQQAQFITYAMHELSHPVSSLLMRLYLMRKQPEKLEENLDALQPVGEHLRRLIEDMREASYLERQMITLDPRDADFQQLVSYAMQIGAEEAHVLDVQLTLESHPHQLIVRVDGEQLVRAISNLIINAIHNTPHGETVSVRIQHIAPLYAVCEIEHTRPEHYEESPSIAFHPFHRPSEGHITHTGLELTIARSIIRLHGGDVTLTVNDENCGVFTVRLELSPTS